MIKDLDKDRLAEVFKRAERDNVLHEETDDTDTNEDFDIVYLHDHDHSHHHS